MYKRQTQYNLVAKLSGGERSRLYLCTILMRNPNFLVLDEPTNDLDILTLQVLEEYLQSYSGCLIVVSHDRYFMDKVADHLLVFEGDGKLKDFPAGYSRYLEWKELKESEEQGQTAQEMCIRDRRGIQRNSREQCPPHDPLRKIGIDQLPKRME